MKYGVRQLETKNNKEVFLESGSSLIEIEEEMNFPCGIFFFTNGNVAMKKAMKSNDQDSSSWHREIFLLL